jgi:asparagine synthase (glutamine-hydrolysing)
VRDLLPRLVWHSDEPSADSSIIPTYYLSKMTRQHVTVALSGDGGDEMFGGYLTYSAYKAARVYAAIPRPLRKGLVEPLVRLLPTSSRKVSFEFKAKRFILGADLPPLRAHYLWNGAFTEEEKQALYTPAMREAVAGVDTLSVFETPFNRHPGLDPMSRLLYVDAKLYLADDILVKVDRASMANSLEVRAPILDHELAEFAARIPPHLKIRGFIKKYIFKKATRGLLPPRTRYRTKKGFSIPVAQWMRGELRETVREYLSPARLAAGNFFDPRAVSRLVDDHLSGAKNNAYHLWALLNFQIWHEMFIENPPPLSYPDTDGVHGGSA